MTKTQKFFQKWAETYDKSWVSFWLKKTQRKTIEKIPGHIEGKTILDLGTGTGSALLILAEKKPKKLVGLDLSPEMISKAREKTKKIPFVELVVADAEKIPYPDNYFDYIICNNIFHHFFAEKPRKVLAEVRRILKNGGWFLMEDLLPPVIFKPFFSFVIRIIEGPIHIYNFSETKKLFLEAGFDNIRQNKLLSAQITLGQKPFVL